MANSRSVILILEVCHELGSVLLFSMSSAKCRGADTSRMARMRESDAEKCDAQEGLH